MNEGSKDVEKQFRKIEQPGIQRHFLDYRSPGVLSSFIAVVQESLIREKINSGRIWDTKLVSKSN